MWYLHLKCSQTIRSKQQHTTERCVPNHLKNTIYHCVCASPQVAVGARTEKFVFSCPVQFLFVFCLSGAGRAWLVCGVCGGPGGKQIFFLPGAGRAHRVGGRVECFLFFFSPGQGAGQIFVFLRARAEKTFFSCPGRGGAGPGGISFVFSAGPVRNKIFGGPTKKTKICQ